MKPDLEARTVHDYNAFVGAEDRHALVSVIDYAELPPIRHCRCRFGVWALFLRDDSFEDLGYGAGSYRYEAGTLICVGPGQVGGVPDNGEVFRIRGWALLFSPELIAGTALAARMHEFSYFSYSVNEALQMTAEERGILITLLTELRDELARPADQVQRGILVDYISLILSYCRRFHERQFSARPEVSHDVLARFEKLLTDYCASDALRRDGLPAVSWFAERLFLSAGYLTDVIRRETGGNVRTLMREHLVRLARERLLSGMTVSETAFSLGFEHPQHFTRLFRRVTGQTPTEYLAQAKGSVS
ncbi:helix-turn-helix domain-containing protein [Sutterella sp.]|uniref:AraC family transcriptional regulator n=1 Tax=Sutterella sp. TaxID=1981025 RepID=UPI0026DF9838|nr:helix-turn-helix domain-containing protein [Sutterella sp.]MDO5531663.1 helix-turn-helix domain-containing protein [Sutterella sp.]